MAARSLKLWKEAEKEWGESFFFPTGALWLAPKKGDYETASIESIREAGLEVDELSDGEAARQFPQINFEGRSWVMLEKEAGYLLARRACHMALKTFLGSGGKYREDTVAFPVPSSGAELGKLALVDGESLSADIYVFACGPWMGQLFPEILRNRVVPTRQEIYYFGTPACDVRFSDHPMPAWVDLGEPVYYGIPGNEWRGPAQACR